MKINVSNLPLNTLFQFDKNCYICSLMLDETRRHKYQLDNPKKFTEVYRVSDDGLEILASGEVIDNPRLYNFDRNFAIFDYDNKDVVDFKITMPLKDITASDSHELDELIPQEDKTPTVKTATCTQTVTRNGVKTATDIKMTDDGVNTKIHFDYTISRTDGKSYDEAGRQQMANNIKKSVTELYSQFGNITGFKSSLAGGKVLLSFDIVSASNDDLEGLRDAFASSGATCK